MNELFLTLANRSITASWLVLCILLLRLLLRRAPKGLRVALWGLVALRLALPFSMESVLSLVPSAETINPGILYAETPAIHSGIPALNSAVNPVIGGSLAPAAGANPLQMWVSAASAVWLAGVAALLLYAAVSYLRLRRRVKTAVPLGENVYRSENAASPFVLGFFRPRIYLPLDVPAQAMENVLAHERAHIRRGEHIIKPAGYLLLCVYWFNPLLWLAYILLCRDIELACDERVIRALGRDGRAEYSEALLACSVPRRLISACPLAFGEVGVRERVKNVLRYKRPAFWIIVVAVLACAAAAVCFLTNPKEKAVDLTGSYQVSGILYEAPMYSFGYTLDHAPAYQITENGELLEKGGVTGEGWQSLGTLSEASLRASEFAALFTGYHEKAASDDFDPSKTGRAVKKAWRAETVLGESAESPVNVSCLVLQMKNGELLLSYGYRGEPDHTRWLFKLQKTADLPDGAAAPAAERGGYVSSECLYMNPLSSYFAADGDSGCRYLLEADSVTITGRATGAGEVISPVSWGYQPFPWTEEEWDALFPVAGACRIGEDYETLRCQPLNDKYCLLQADGRLLLVEMHDVNRMGKQIWSIFALTPEVGDAPSS